MSKWAVMVCLDPEEDDWLFVTEHNASTDNWSPKPVLFNELEDALECADTWTIPGNEHMVSVVRYT